VILGATCIFSGGLVGPAFPRSLPGGGVGAVALLGGGAVAAAHEGADVADLAVAEDYLVGTGCRRRAAGSGGGGVVSQMALRRLVASDLCIEVLTRGCRCSVLSERPVDIVGSGGGKFGGSGFGVGDVFVPSSSSSSSLENSPNNSRSSSLRDMFSLSGQIRDYCVIARSARIYTCAGMPGMRHGLFLRGFHSVLRRTWYMFFGVRF